MSRALRSCAAAGLIAAVLLTACARRTTSRPATPTPAAASAARTAALSEVVNVVKARAPESTAFAQVSVGYVLKAGGQVQTGGDSRARLDLSDHTIVRLAQNSSFTLQDVQVSDGSLLARVKLEAGKIWVSLTGGQLEVDTPVGVAAVRGSFAVFAYSAGDPDNPDDDLLVVDCLEGECAADNDAASAQLGNLQGFALTRAGGVRLTLTGSDVQDFLLNNPEGAGLVATLTAAPPATDTPAPPGNPPTEAQAATGTPTATLGAEAPPDTPTSTSAAAATTVKVTPIPPAPVIGQHTVKAGETLFCIGRGYGILPAAIAQANGLVSSDVATGQVLKIPAVQWTNIPPGPVCPPQFRSPFLGLPTSTSAPAGTPTGTATPTCPQGEFFDPVMNRCNPVPTPYGGLALSQSRLYQALAKTRRGAPVGPVSAALTVAGVLIVGWAYRRRHHL